MNNINLSSLSISNSKYENESTKIIKKEKTEPIKVNPSSLFDSLKIEQKKSINPNLHSINFVSDIESKINTPNSYLLKNKTSLKDGVDFFEFSNGNDKKTVRAVEINKNSLKDINVLFSRNSSLNVDKLNKDPKNLMVMNGTFFTGTGSNGRTAGDVKGSESSSSLKPTDTKGLITNSEKSVRAEIEQRFSFAIDKNGKAEIFRGGLDEDNQKDIKVSIGGGVLLFDSKNSNLYKSLSNENNYEKEYLNKNDKRITSSGQGGDPNRATPRSAIGIMPDGGVVFVNIGEGKYRRAGGMTPYQVAKTLKDMGCSSAIMLDGGGAPVMKVKDQNGKVISNTSPDISGGYGNNKSFLVVKK